MSDGEFFLCSALEADLRRRICVGPEQAESIVDGRGGPCRGGGGGCRLDGSMAAGWREPRGGSPEGEAVKRWWSAVTMSRGWLMSKGPSYCWYISERRRDVAVAEAVEEKATRAAGVDTDGARWRCLVGTSHRSRVKRGCLGGEKMSKERRVSRVEGAKVGGLVWPWATGEEGAMDRPW